MSLLKTLNSESTAANGNRYAVIAVWFCFIVHCWLGMCIDSTVIQDWLQMAFIYVKESVVCTTIVILSCAYNLFL